MNKIKKVAIYSNYSINKLPLYEEIKKYKFELVQIFNEDEFINTEIKLRIINSNIGYEKTLKLIKKIRSNFSKKQSCLIVAIERENIADLTAYIEAGVNDYIKKPYVALELKTILENNLNVLDEDTKFQLTIDILPFPIWVNDLDGIYTEANINFAQHFNATVDEIIGKHPKYFYDQEEVNKIKRENLQILKEQKTIKFNGRYISEGKERTAEVYKKPVYNATNEIVGIIGTIVDVTDVKEAKEEIRKQSITDPLTSLINRRGFYEYITNKEFKNISVMLIDIDNFKSINDNYGHCIGDKVLNGFSEKLKNEFSDEFLCRLSGDEFLVIFETTNDEKVICQKIKNLLNNENTPVNIRKYNVSASIGIVINSENENIDEILAKADMAMYKAKDMGKNNYVVYSNELEKERIKKLEIERIIRENNQENKFILHYQPQYTKFNTLKGFEALLRWKNNKYKDIPINEVVKIMEDSDLIIQVGRFIIRKACEFAEKINENRKNKLVVSINVSTIQIMERDFIEEFENIIIETKVDPTNIGIEITESTILNDIEENSKKIEKLRNMGIEISIDDFGAGYSSLNYLLQLPITTIKLDKTLIDLVHKDKKIKNMIDGMIKFAKACDMYILAEGIEKEEQKRVLKEIDVDYYQGYLFNKALKEEEILELIKKEVN